MSAEPAAVGQDWRVVIGVGATAAAGVAAAGWLALEVLVELGVDDSCSSIQTRSTRSTRSSA